jgi:hypothetical protein
MINSITIDGVEYQKSQHVKFIRDMRKIGLEIQLYHGRYFWHGPAVVVSSLSDAVPFTDIKCIWDDLGNQVIVYPRVTDDALGRIKYAA